MHTSSPVSVEMLIARLVSLAYYTPAARPRSRSRSLSLSFGQILRDAKARVDADPMDSIAHHQLGCAHLAAGSHASAAESLRRSLDLGWLSMDREYGDPAAEDPLGAYHAAAAGLLDVGDFEAAEACWRHSLQLDSTNAGVRERLAATLRKAGRLAEAADALYETLEWVAEEDEARSWLYLDLGSLIEELAPIPGTGCEWGDPTDVPSVKIGDRDGGKSLTAEQCYRLALQAAGEGAGEAHKRLADVLAASHGAAAAQPHFAAAARLMPHDICCATHVHYGVPSTGERGRRLPPCPLPPLPPLPTEGDDGDGATVPLSALMVPPPTPLGDGEDGGGEERKGDGDRSEAWEAWARRAAETFEAHGVVVVPELLSDSACASLLEAVEAAEALGVAADLTDETREADARVHMALALQPSPEDEQQQHQHQHQHQQQQGAAAAAAADVVSDATRQLWPLLRRVLQVDAQPEAGGVEAAPLLGAGFMRVANGAVGQALHKDVHGHDRHRHPTAEAGGGGAARAISVQLQITDTAAATATTAASGSDGAGLGALAVLPGSHRPDAARGNPARIHRAIARPDETTGVVRIAVPAGTATLYSSRLWHLGDANRSERRRTFCFLTVAEPDAPAPAGLIHTMELEDIGAWHVCASGLSRTQA